MFGPGTKSLLTEALRKRQLSSTSEESEEVGLLFHLPIISLIHLFIYLQSHSYLYLPHSFFLTLSLFLLRSFSSPPCCSLQNGPPPDVVKTQTKQTEKPQAKSLFSDDEDSQVCFFFFNTHSQVCIHYLNVVDGGTSHASQLHQYLHEPYN